MLIAVAVAGCLALASASLAWGASRAGGVSPAVSPVPVPAAAREAGAAPGLAGCEQRLERARRGVPVLAVAGASFTAGVGPDNPGRSWAVLLARRLHWDAVVYGDPGAGYVRAGAGRQGPVAAELAREDLRALAPAVVIVQAGHDDIGIPATVERQRVARTVALIRAEAPRARIVLLTVFPGQSRPLAAHRTDQAIVAAGRAADPGVIIMDPLTARWTFPRAPDGLHPTAAGDAWIARRAAQILAENGVRAGPSRGVTVCDVGLPAPRGRRINPS
jgi:acyl-CoA thioesterase I